MVVHFSVQFWRSERCTFTVFMEVRRGSCNAFIWTMAHLISRAQNRIGKSRGVFEVRIAMIGSLLGEILTLNE